MTDTLHRESPRRRRSAGLIILTVMLLGLTGVIWQLRPGIDIRVTNSSKTALRDVRIYFQRVSRAIGTIAPGSSAQSRMAPVSETSLEMEWSTDSGGRHRVNVGGYFSRGFRGQLDVEIGDEGVVRFDDHTRTWIWSMTQGQPSLHLSTGHT